MVFFAIALVPDGNILRIVNEIKTRTFRAGDGTDGRGLPEGIYLGFYGSEGLDRIPDKAQLGKIAGIFRSKADMLFPNLPPALGFTAAGSHEGKWYLVPQEGIPEKTTMAADKTAGACGFAPLGFHPISPRIGFFVSNDVTPPPFNAFSFRHMDAVLYCVESGDPDCRQVRWIALAKVARRTGPRKKAFR